MILSLYIASVCFSLATEILIGTGVGQLLVREGYTPSEGCMKNTFWDLLKALLICFIPVINVICMKDTIKNIKTVYSNTKKNFVKTETTSNTEVDTKTESKSDTKTENKSASMSRTYNNSMSDTSRENKGPVLKKSLGSMRS